MELIDVSQVAKRSEFRVFLDAISSNGQVKGIVAPHCATFSRTELDSLIDFIKTYGAKGLAWIKVVNGQLESPITKFFSREVLDELKAKMEAKDGDLMLFVADKPKLVADSLAQLRLKLGNQLGLIDKSRFDCLWILDFPLFQWNEEEGRFESEHHPFTAPKEEQLPLLDEDPGKVLSRSYDLVINGNERASGSVRIHRREVQEKIFNILKLKPEEVQLRFGFFLDALQYGTPPHAGIAPGLDRLVEVITGADSMRDVIAFPKTQKGTCMVTGAPAEVSEAQLKELFIKVDAPKQ
jgi:aspartyl-tRNA synthetase